MKRKDIREFDCIRGVIEKIYTYGFYTREEYICGGTVGSPRAYDDIVRQLRDLYYYDIDSEASPLEEDTNKRGHYKSYKFKRDYFACVGDTLAAAYGLYAISDDAIATTIRCLSLASSKSGATVADVARISEKEDGRYQKSTISRRIKSLQQCGYVVEDKKRNLLNTTLSGLSDNEIIDLYYFVSFYAGAGYPRIPAIFLQKTLKRHIAHRKLPAPADIFLFRDNACGNVFDEQVVHELLQCCQSHTVVKVTLRGNVCRLKPVYLKIDTKLGRWYLFAICEDNPMVIRVSNIKKVKPSSEQFDYTQALCVIEKAYQHNYISGKKAVAPIRIEAELRFASPAMRTQFDREMLIGRVEKHEQKEIFCADVGDVTEIKPFLRSYGAYLRVLPGDGHSLDTELQNEYERMLSGYGVV